MLEHVADHRGITPQNRVDDHDVGVRVDVLQSQLGADRGATGRRPAKWRERQLEQQADEEDGRGVHEDREQSQQHVGKPVAVAGGEPAEWNADRERHDQRPERELESRSTVLDENRRHLALVGQRGAEVTTEQP